MDVSEKHGYGINVGAGASWIANTAGSEQLALAHDLGFTFRF
jgi:hypothetical protein